MFILAEARAGSSGKDPGLGAAGVPEVKLGAWPAGLAGGPGVSSSGALRIRIWLGSAGG